MHILAKLIEPHAVLMLFVFLYCFLGPAWDGWRERQQRGTLFWAFLWLVVAVLALVSWVLLILGG